MCTQEHSTLCKLVPILRQLHSLCVQRVQVEVTVLVFQCLYCISCVRRWRVLVDWRHSKWLWHDMTYPAMHRHIWHTTVSSSLTTACTDSARPTRRCVLFDGHTTPLAITHGTHYLLNYDNVTCFGEFKQLPKTPVRGPRCFMTF